MDTLDGISHSVIIEEAIGSIEQEVSQQIGMKFEPSEEDSAIAERILLGEKHGSALVVGDDANIHHTDGNLNTVVVNADEDLSLDGSLLLNALETEESSPSTKKVRGSKKWRRKFGVGEGRNLETGKGTNFRSWQQKRVQIKTLEGAFSVTMWASGGSIAHKIEIVRLMLLLFVVRR